MFERIVNVFPTLLLATLIVAGGIFLPGTSFALQSYAIPQTTGASISWDPNTPKPDGYHIYQRKKGESFNYAKPCWTGPGSTGRVYNLEYDTVYYFVVRAYNGALESVDSKEVSFVAAAPAPATYSITATSGAHGTIAPGGSVKVKPNTAKAFSIVPHKGYHVADVKVDGVSMGTPASFRFDQVRADHTIHATFAADPSDEPPISADQPADSPIDNTPGRTDLIGEAALMKVMQFGDIQIDRSWKRIQFNHRFVNPVVVAGPIGFKDGDPAVVRIRNVDASGFEICLQEWDYLDDDHLAETVSYLAMEAGTYRLKDGTRIEAASLTTKATNFVSIGFRDQFKVVPVVMTSLTSFNDAHAVTGRIDRVERSGFRYRMQEQQSNPQNHGTEKLAYIAWEPSSGTVGSITYLVKKTGRSVTHRSVGLHYDGHFSSPPAFLADMQSTNGGEPASLRFNNKRAAAVDVWVDEEQSWDVEMKHSAEVVGYILISGDQAAGGNSDGNATADNGKTGSASQDDVAGAGQSQAGKSASGGGQAVNTGTPVATGPDENATGSSGQDGSNTSGGNILPATLAFGEVRIDHNWKRVRFDKVYVNPVVVAGPVSHNGGDPVSIRIRNVNTAGFEIRLQEWDYLDGLHTTETVNYLVLEAGSYTLKNGTRIEAANLSTNATTFKTVVFDQRFNTIPVVMTSLTSFNDTQAVTGRVDRVQKNSFQYRMQEQQANGRHHDPETLSYVAWEPSSGQLGDVTYLVQKTNNVVRDAFYCIFFDEPFKSAPTFLADMQTADGGETANLRCNDKDRFAVDILVDEEQSRDDEVSHTSEVVGFMAFSR
jgi:hypothetical protein